MIVRHSETNRPFEPSVRFYRTIALSFLVVTIILLATIIFVTSKKATLIITAKEDVKSANLNVDLGSDKTTGAVRGMVTSTKFAWTENFYPTTYKSESGIAVGSVIIYNKSNLEQTLVKTTRLLTPDNILFRLNERVLVPANGQVVAAVYADASGEKSEIGPSQFTIPGLSADRQKFVYAESKEAMKGGVKKVGVLSEADLQSARTIYNEHLKQSFIKQLPSYLDGYDPIVAVMSQEVSASNEVGASVSDFSLSGVNTLVVAWYQREDLKEIITKEIDTKVDLSLEKVLAISGEPLVALSSYNLAKGTAQLSVSQEAKVTLAADAEKVSPGQFLGQSKEEIERYVLGLEHVSAVDVSFSPGWARKSPTAVDRIKVVIKSVK